MDKSEVIKILRNEQTCVRAADNCGRDCANCHLVMDDKAILEAYETAIEMLSEPERKKGKWIKGIDVPGRNPYLHLSDALYCSVCHNEAYWDTDYGQQIFDYCPNCGAKMEGEEDG